MAAAFGAQKSGVLPHLWYFSVSFDRLLVHVLVRMISVHQYTEITKYSAQHLRGPECHAWFPITTSYVCPSYIPPFVSKTMHFFFFILPQLSKGRSKRPHLLRTCSVHRLEDGQYGDSVVLLARDPHVAISDCA